MTTSTRPSCQATLLKMGNDSLRPLSSPNDRGSIVSGADGRRSNQRRPPHPSSSPDDRAQTFGRRPPSSRQRNTSEDAPYPSSSRAARRRATPDRQSIVSSRSPLGSNRSSSRRQPSQLARNSHRSASLDPDNNVLSPRRHGGVSR